MAGQGGAPADEIEPTQFVQRSHERLSPHPPRVHGNNSLVLGRATGTKRVRPLALREPIAGVPAADVNGVGRDDRSSLAEARQLADVNLRQSIT